MSPSIRCQNGHEVSDDYDYCGRCGAAVTPVASAKASGWNPKALWFGGGIVLAVALVVLLLVVLDHSDPTRDASEGETRRSLVQDVCGEESGAIPPSSTWEPTITEKESALTVKLETGALYVVLVHGDSVDDNSDVYQVLCYPSGGGKAYQNSVVTWSNGGQTYEFADKAIPNDSPSTSVPSEPPSSGESSTDVPGDGGTCEYASGLEEDTEGIKCVTARKITETCPDVGALKFVGEEAGLENWQYVSGHIDADAFATSDLQMGNAVVSCGYPTNGIDVHRMHEEAMAVASTFKGSPAFSAACTSKSGQPLDELTAGKESAACLVAHGSGWSDPDKEFTLVVCDVTTTDPYFKLSAREWE
jgi:hypothetical protein